MPGVMKLVGDLRCRFERHGRVNLQMVIDPTEWYDPQGRGECGFKYLVDGNRPDTREG
jgi:hypothetical protein